MAEPDSATRTVELYPHPELLLTSHPTDVAQVTGY